MHHLNTLLSLIVPMLLVGLLATAVIAYYRVRALGLPVSNVTTTATIILPVITGIALRGAYGVALRLNGSSWTSKASVSWTAFGLFMLLVIYDTVLATLALTNMAPPNALTCNLERRWSRMFSDKNAQLIRGIQERHQCCGFRSSRDRAWPFPDRDHTAAACAQTFGRQQGCLGGWRQDMQITAGLILLVAAAVFLLKLAMLVLYRNGRPLNASAWYISAPTTGDANEFRTGRDNDQNNPRRIEDAYHDDPQLGNNERGSDWQTRSTSIHEENEQGSVLQPSRIHDGNEWREA